MLSVEYFVCCALLVLNELCVLWCVCRVCCVVCFVCFVFVVCVVCVLCV